MPKKSPYTFKMVPDDDVLEISVSGGVVNNTQSFIWEDLLFSKTLLNHNLITRICPHVMGGTPLKKGMSEIMKPKEINSKFIELFGFGNLNTRIRKIHNAYFLKENNDLKMWFAFRNGLAVRHECLLIDEHAQDIRQMIKDGYRHLVWFALMNFNTINHERPFNTKNLKEHCKSRKYDWKHIVHSSEFFLKKLYLSSHSVLGTDCSRIAHILPPSMHRTKINQLVNGRFTEKMVEIIRAHRMIKNEPNDYYKWIFNHSRDMLGMMDDLKDFNDDKEVKEILKPKHFNRCLKDKNYIKEYHDKLSEVQRKCKDKEYEIPFQYPDWVKNKIKSEECEAVLARTPKDLNELGEQQNNCIYSRKDECRRGESTIYSIVRDGKVSSVFEVDIRYIGTTDEGIAIVEHKANSNSDPSEEDKEFATNVLRELIHFIRIKRITKTPAKMTGVNA